MLAVTQYCMFCVLFFAVKHRIILCQPFVFYNYNWQLSKDPLNFNKRLIFQDENEILGNGNNVRTSELLGFYRRSSASEMFVMNNISNFETLIRKSIFVFKTRLSNSDNTIISTLQSSWIITDTIWKVWKDKPCAEA